MKGDFTRDTFDPTKYFSRVLMQQGRVQLDADWNEQTSILLHYLRTLAKDILGPHAGPASDMGFDIITQDLGTALASKLSAIEPDTDRKKILEDQVKQGNAVIGPGRYYVQGILVENYRGILYTEQPGYPFNDETKLEALQILKGGFLVYLDVWERHVIYVEDDAIREAALGGPDTCTRAQVVWQVKVLLQSQLPANTEFNCKTVPSLLQLGTGRLRARARLDKPPTELCTIPPESRYRGAENQLYRVEIHQGGTATGGATFKWSRENGSVTFPIRSLAGTTVTLEHLGRDKCLGLAPGNWVEVVDDANALGEKAGLLARVDAVNRDEFTVTLKWPDGVTNLPAYTEADAEAKHALLRRWDHAGDPTKFGGALQIVEQNAIQAGWIDLEDGVQIWFAKGGTYKAGDYWMIPARTATGDVEWPDELQSDGTPKLDSDGNPIPAAQAAKGPRHYYAPLVLVHPQGDRRDCRCSINSLPCAYRYAFGSAGIGPDF